MFPFKKIFKKHTLHKEEANFYEAGRQTLVNSKFNHASNADFEDLASVDRDTMRARARWLFANNPIVSNIDETIINNSVGAGIRFQSNTGIKDFDNEIEALWEDFIEAENFDVTGRYGLYEFQRMLLGQRMTDGEVLIQKVIRKDNYFPLSVQGIEVDNLAKNINYGGLSRIVDGIELSKFGKIQKYHFQDNYTNKRYSVNSENIINFYKSENRFSQYRGVSEYKQIITSLQAFASFNDSTLTSADARARISYVVESEGTNARPVQTRSIDGVEYPVEMLNGVFVEYLNSGQKLKVIDPTASGTGYKDFVDTTIRMIASGRKVSYELAFKDFTKTNFSSARASLIQDHKVFTQNQQHMTTSFLNPIYRLFVKTMFMKGNIRSVNSADYFKHEKKFVKPLWITPERTWIDPLKETNAVAKEIELGITTLSEVAKSKGKDFEAVVAQRVREREILKKAGLVDEESASVIKEKQK